ncbi:Immunity protein 47 [Arthrobacter alpinus]|uniref:Immunity protein 47 n=1 Tax=Arthrobacter alpinus TaxID=656366 RepID=A0A1H5PEE6_9MICC|nr:Imm47 family immunity protein [Arthrobacter alpinus]SEF12146.1 Immunity protein 47 [Arthrobacter alpinus]
MTSDQLFDGVWFGPPKALSEKDAVHARFHEEGRVSFHGVLRGCIEFCKMGDFSKRQLVFDTLQSTSDSFEALDALAAGAAVGRERDFKKDRFWSFTTHAADEVHERLAGLGTVMLARHIAPECLRMLKDESTPRERWGRAYASLDSLLDLESGSVTAQSSYDEIGDAVFAVLDGLKPKYIINGKRFEAAGTMNVMIASAERALESGEPFSNRDAASCLSIWTGDLCPVFTDHHLTAADVQGLADYVSRISQLDWKPGHKYFYGHDVEGGPGLRSVEPAFEALSPARRPTTSASLPTAVSASSATAPPSAQLSGGAWFGPAQPGSERDAILASLQVSTAGPETQFRDALELCKMGDFTHRQTVFDTLQGAAEERDALDAFFVSAAIGRDSDFERTGFWTFLETHDSAYFHIAGSGLDLLARAFIPQLLAILEEESTLHETWEQAYSSLDTLLDLASESVFETNDPDEIAAAAHTILGRQRSQYLLRGKPFEITAITDSMIASVTGALEQGKPFSNVGYAPLLSVWTGDLCPAIDTERLTAVDVQALIAYVIRISQLAWQPGHKYFYGHDVDGGPGLGPVPPPRA